MWEMGGGETSVLGGGERKIGDLLYCRNRGRTTCCFHNETCGKDMVEVLLKQITNKMYNKLFSLEE